MSLGATSENLGQKTTNSEQATKNPMANDHNQNRSVQTNSCGANFKSGNNRFPKLEFPSFDGHHPRSWVRKSEKYFKIFQIEDGQKVEIAVMYLTGKADVWVQCFLVQNIDTGWEDFAEAICVRFGEKRGADVIEEFNKLIQEDDVESYNEKFEELRACMLAYNPTLPESYFISSYISGLKEEIKSLVKLGKPDFLVNVFEQARLHYGAVQAILKLSKNPWQPNPISQNNPEPPYFNAKPDNQNFSSNSNSKTSSKLFPTKNPVNTMNNQLVEPRKNPGMCYRCGDRYFVGHKCKVQSLHSMMTFDVGEVQSAECGEMETENEKVELELLKDQSEVYVHALTGSNSLNTIRIKGMARSRPITILIDSGSTNSFLDPDVAKEAGFKPQESKVMAVAMANGSKMFSHQNCENFEWMMQGHKFKFDMSVLKLGGCDMVLGVDWLREFSPLNFDFKHLTLSFVKDGNRIDLKGAPELATLKMMCGLKVQNSYK